MLPKITLYSKHLLVLELIIPLSFWLFWTTHFTWISQSLARISLLFNCMNIQFSTFIRFSMCTHSNTKFLTKLFWPKQLSLKVWGKWKCFYSMELLIPLFPSQLFGEQLPTSSLSLGSTFRQHLTYWNHLILQNNLVPQSVIGRLQYDFAYPKTQCLFWNNGLFSE